MECHQGNCLSISIFGVAFNCKLYETSCVKTQKKVIPGNNKDQKTHELVLNSQTAKVPLLKVAFYLI